MKREKDYLPQVRNAVFRGCNSFLSEIEKNIGSLGLRVDFWKEDSSSELNRLLTNVVVRGMLEGRDYVALDMMFPFIVQLLIVRPVILMKH